MANKVTFSENWNRYFSFVYFTLLLLDLPQFLTLHLVFCHILKINILKFEKLKSAAMAQLF